MNRTTPSTTSKKTVRDAVQIVAQRAEDAGVELNCDISSDIPESRYDEESIHRAVLNLVTNALDAMEEVESGLIKIQCGHDLEADRLFVSIADNGPRGFPRISRRSFFRHSIRPKVDEERGLVWLSPEKLFVSMMVN